jgi:tetratricopeptide (TPR) repeat protein
MRETRPADASSDSIRRIGERTGQSSQDALADVAFARALVRNARNPAWLRTVDRGGRGWPRFGAFSDDLAATVAVQRFIGAALAQAPERVRTIVDKTVLGGETCRDVASVVGVSLRQLHRDRAVAVALIARALRYAGDGPPAQSAIATGGLELQVAHARALVEMGHFDPAESILVEMARSESVGERSQALHHLAMCALERGDIAAAEAVVRRALENARNDDDATVLARIGCAATAFASGELAKASRTLRACARQARTSLERASSDRTRTSLVEILVLQSAIVSCAGSPRIALAHAQEARLRLSHLRHPPAYLRFATVEAHVGASINSGVDFSAIAAELCATYDAASAIGFLRTALAQVINLSTIDTLQGAYQTAADRLLAARPLAGMLPACRTKSEHAILLALAFVRTSRAVAALEILACEAHERPAQSGHLCGLLAVTRAKARIAMGRPAEAIDDLDTGASHLARHLPNAVGPCLHVKAQALIALRRFYEAETVARASIGLIERGCHGSVLAVARRTLASLRR